MEVVFDRLPIVLAGTAKKKSPHYDAIRNGLMTPGVAVGKRSKAWPRHEWVAINKARLAGKSDDEIRRLVRELIAARLEAA